MRKAPKKYSARKDREDAKPSATDPCCILGFGSGRRSEASTTSRLTIERHGIVTSSTRNDTLCLFTEYIDLSRSLVFLAGASVLKACYNITTIASSCK